MKRATLWLIFVMTACQRHAPPVKSAAAPEGPEPVAITRWTRATELFVEYPPLRIGEVSRFAIHLTRMDNFRPVMKGVVEVRLSREGAAPQVFRVESPSRPGIFGVDVKPAALDGVRLSITFRGEGIEDTHDLGTIPVPETEEDAGAIPFLKEQQWALDFATAVAVNRSLRESLRVPAEVTPRSGGQVEVDAPLDGTLLMDRVPVVGEWVKAGQILASVQPPTAAPADLAGLELARNEASTQWALARKDRQRAERLVASGAAPAKRLEEAQALEATMEARVNAAQARLAQYEASAKAETSGARSFAIRAPIAGIVDAVRVAPGSRVKAGEALFQLVDVDRVFVSAIVPESEYPRVGQLTGAELEVPGVPEAMPLTRRVTVGRVVDAPSRTFAVIYEFDNRQRHVAVNQTVYVRLLLAASGGGGGVVVPETALVDDGGRPIVFVQVGGEAFARRPVETGARNGGLVEIRAGLRGGERVVTTGAHLVRLASLSSQVPAHGHVH